MTIKYITRLGQRLGSGGGSIGATEFLTTAVFDEVVDNGTHTTGTLTIDWTTGNQQKVTINGAGPFTVAFTEPPGPCILRLRVQQGATPGTLTWPAEVKWPAGAPPVLSALTGRYDWMTFVFDGTNFDGMAAINFS